MGCCYYQINKIYHYHKEAHQLSPALLEEKIGTLYSHYSPPHTFANPAEDKAVIETSFAPYTGMKVYL